MKQLFLDGTLNLTMLMSNESNSAMKDFNSVSLSSVLETSLERCSHQWREEKVQGKCYGLKNSREFVELRTIQVVPSPTFCKALCCELGERCTTWQYLIKNYPPPRPNERECYLGGAVKFGEINVEYKSGAYCETSPVQKWRGRQLKDRTVNNETKRVRSTFGREFNCEWGEDLSSPCDGLGQVYLKHLFVLSLSRVCS